MIDFKSYLIRYRDVIDKEVPGYFYPIDIILFYCVLKHIQKDIDGDICEIGVAEGKSAICLSEFKREKENFYLYDIFSRLNREITSRNIKKFGNYSNVEWNLVDSTSLKLDEVKFQNKLRLLHIDGCHEHWAVLSDLSLFSNFVRDDGIIVMDDYNDYEYPGVNSATTQYCLSKENDREWRIFAIGDNKAYLCRKNLHSKYINSVLEFMQIFNSYLNRPFEIKMCLRQIIDVNVLLCDAREEWSVEKIKNNLFSKLLS